MEKPTYPATYDPPQSQERVLSHSISNQQPLSRVASSQKITSILLKIHIYLGTLCALFLLIIASTGILLGFYQQLRYSASPYKLDAPVNHPLSPEKLVEKIYETYPHAQIIELTFSTDPSHAVLAKLKNADHKSQLIFVNPATGLIFASQSADHKDWLGFIHSLHHGKPFGSIGETVASVNGILFLVLWIVGFIVWKRNPMRSYLWQGKSWKVKLRSFHRGVGLTLGGIAAVIATFGALYQFDFLDQWIDPVPPVKMEKIAVQPLDSLELEQIIAKGRAIYPNAPLEEIAFPGNSMMPWMHWIQLEFQGRKLVYFQGNEVIGTSSPSSHWKNLLYYLHTMEFLHKGRSWVIAILGLITLGLITSGLVTYWRKH
ncbi:PepSY-associated TM helix domain-containing protein [Candidatus Nitrosacidococcus tergens]|uniref:PepSY-associated TM helix domain protein n=1 Tax=Candidatus Nitrosacidococcus tergens TaxID=553981 RepID=A0A7G1Q8W6_9GAMM|nr:PepSY-associated TM helix domain-containing protein [Candidatus Nitrosacidococcus tergens]CAB1275327.1 membrane protein of unknown function [Candidatus Nitrosacidococcus tergens]